MKKIENLHLPKMTNLIKGIFFLFIWSILAIAILARPVKFNQLAGLILYLAIFLAMFVAYLHKYYPHFLKKERDLLLLGLIIVGQMGIAKLFMLTPFNLEYAIPIATSSMLIAILINEHLSLFSTVFVSIIIGSLISSRIDFILLFIGSGMTGIYAASISKTYSDLSKAGFIIGLVNAAIILASGLFYDYSPAQLSRGILLGIANGVFSSILTIGLLPLLETIFSKVSKFKLLELSDLNAPLLRELGLQAPGTYHHSMLVASLAEQAALKVQANSLLARVAAYYHDIGKITKADYFVENQTERNKHEDLKPSLSASVLKAHVKEGVEKAKKKRLPSEIVDIISQHHGSSLIAYFYHQAEEAQGEKDPVNVNDFKYPGPRPQTKEAAIIMLADSVEAACRALVKPTPRRIEETVKKVINNKFIESELAECDLTLSDLTLIADTFSRILTGAYHVRVEYPEKGKVNGDSNSQSAKKKEDRLKEGKKDS